MKKYSGEQWCREISEIVLTPKHQTMCVVHECPSSKGVQDDLEGMRSDIYASKVEASQQLQDIKAKNESMEATLQQLARPASLLLAGSGAAARKSRY